MSRDIDWGDLLGIGIALFMLFLAALAVEGAIPANADLATTQVDLFQQLPSGAPPEAYLASALAVVVTFLTYFRRLLRNRTP